MPKGIKNGNWKGGRSIASNGYVLVRVGRDHHLSDCRGYAYEHRLVAEKKLGRRLRRGEIVHHKDGNRINNSRTNIDVKKSIHHHLAEHRKSGKRRRNPGEKNRLIKCACGCGARFKMFDGLGRPRRYISGHNMRKSSG